MFPLNGSYSHLTGGLLARMAPFQDEKITAYTSQMLRALAYLKEQLIIHRDLKGKILTTTLLGP